jgi:hypothetical protein
MTRVCRTPAQVRAACAQAEAFVNQGHAVALSCRKLDTRTLEQNARLNAMCQDVSRAVVWHGQRLSKDDWRHMFVASYRKGQRAVPGIDGGFVVLGASSRDLSVSECSDVMEIIAAFGAERDVKWSEPR